MNDEPISDPIRARLAPLFRWQRTDDFARQVGELDEDAKDDLLTDGRWKPLREALILRDFAVTLGYPECKLCPENERFPDAALRSAGSELQVEITEVLTAGRKRDKEYKEFKANPIQKTLSHHEWDQVEEAGARWVTWTTAAVEKKLKYSRNTKFDIVVYNNISHLFELPEIAELSEAVGKLLAEASYHSHWVWQVRSTTIDLLWPRVLRLKIPAWENRF